MGGSANTTCLQGELLLVLVVFLEEWLYDLFSILSLGDAEFDRRLCSNNSAGGGGGFIIDVLAAIVVEVIAELVLFVVVVVVSQCVKEMQTSPTRNCLQGSLYLANVWSGLELLQPWPTTKNGCSNVASTATWKNSNFYQRLFEAAYNNCQVIYF